MSRMTKAELAGQKLEGSWARQDAIMAARRRMKPKAEPNPNARSPEQLIADMEDGLRADFAALIAAINSVDDYTMRCVAISALEKRYPQYADLAQVAA